jgi:hypothetical protein
MDHARLQHYEVAVVAARGVAKRAEEAANECARIRNQLQAEIHQTERMNRVPTEEQRLALAVAEAAFVQACAEWNAANAAVNSAGETLNNCLEFAKRMKQ